MLITTKAFADLLALDLTPANRPVLENSLLTCFGASRQQDIMAALDLVLNHDAAAPAKIHAHDIGPLYVASLTELTANCPLSGGTAAAAPPTRIQFIDQQYDFLATTGANPDWGLLRCVNFLVRAKLRPAKKIAAVTTFRNQGIGILEWIAHHRLLGIDDFIIYAEPAATAAEDGSARLLNALAVQEVIHLIWNATASPATALARQAKAYGHACEFFTASRHFEWLLFAGMDDFLITKALRETPQMLHPLDDFFARIPVAPASPTAILLYGKSFTSRGAFRRKAGLMFDRFQHYAAAGPRAVIVASKHCLAATDPAAPLLPAGSSMLSFAMTAAGNPKDVLQSLYHQAQINHYGKTSFEEFIGGCPGGDDLPDLTPFFAAGNDQVNESESLPATWKARLKAEMEALRALPGVAAELVKIDAAFKRRLQVFDRQHDSEASFYKNFVREI